MIPCPICNSSETSPFFNKDNINYYKCSSCSFRFSKPPVNYNFQDDIKNYEGAYINYLDVNKFDNRNYQLLFNWISKRADNSELELLDIGCGSGKFVNYLREKQINATGIEPSSILFDKYLKERACFYNSSLEDYCNTSKRYDIVTLVDVLEHVEHLGSFIANIAKIQPVNGYMIIELPLIDNLFATLLGKKWPHYNKYHYSYFTKTTLNKLLNEKGYELELCKYRGKYFQISYIWKYALNFMLGAKGHVKVPAFLNNIAVYLNTYDVICACFKKVN